MANCQCHLKVDGDQGELPSGKPLHTWWLIPVGYDWEGATGRMHHRPVMTRITVFRSPVIEVPGAWLVVYDMCLFLPEMMNQIHYI